MLRYEQMIQNETRLLALTLTRSEFQDLGPVFQTSLETILQEQTLEGLERIGRTYITYRHCLLLTVEDR